MSINESKEFEAINQKTNERKFVEESECQCKEAFHNVKRAKAKKKALLCICLTALCLVAVVFGVALLEDIGWINHIFSIVLSCSAGAAAMFKVGYYWNDFEK